jgi:hypothetical protein
MKKWLKSITPSAWFRLVCGTLIWLAITRFFLVPRYEHIRSSQDEALDILILLIWIALPLMLIFQRIDLFGFKLDHGENLSTADKQVPPPAPDESEIVVNPDQVSSPEKKKACGAQTFLSLRARIHFTHEAGFNALMRIQVNNQVLGSGHIVGKDMDAEIADGRKFSWFDSKNDTWRIPFSPDFKTNYTHSRYRVVNGDAYLFLFDLSSISPDNGEYSITIQHVGGAGNEALKNSIVVRDIVTY